MVRGRLVVSTEGFPKKLAVDPGIFKVKKWTNPSSVLPLAIITERNRVDFNYLSNT